MTASVIYTGDLRTEATHLRSGSVIETDAPVNNQGKGDRFSPTDLVATALASCILTTMGIAANTHKIDIVGTSCQVEKIMTASPRKIGEIRVIMDFPKKKPYTPKEEQILELAAANCPVMLSLHPDCRKKLVFNWPAE